MPPTTKESAEAPATSVMSVPKPGDSVCDIEKFLTLEAKSREVHALRSLAPLLQVRFDIVLCQSLNLAVPDFGDAESGQKWISMRFSLLLAHVRLETVTGSCVGPSQTTGYHVDTPLI